MAAYGLPVLFTLFLWWFSTGAILYLDSLAPRTFVWSMSGASALLALALWGAAVTCQDASLINAYLAFCCGLAVWGWQLVSFYMGYLTGPRKTACEADCRGWRRFIEAIRTSLYHELTVCLSAAILIAITWGQPNQLAVWTFLVLWWMHQSAKLNLFFGVPNLGEELLPAHLRYLGSFMTRKSMNLLFPVSVSVSTVITVILAQKAAATDATPFDVAGFTMLATLMALAIAEHWFLVAPLQTNGLWQWGERARASGDSEAPTGKRDLGQDRPNLAGQNYRDQSAVDTAVSPEVAHSPEAHASLESWTSDMPDLCDPKGLRKVLESVGSGIFGDVESLKGVAKTSASWIRFEVAGDCASINPIAPHRSPEPLVIAVGRRFDRVGLKAAFDACSAAG